MKKILFLFALAITMVIAVSSVSSCENYATRSLGGSTTINLPAGERLVEATWKNSNLWYLTEPMDSDYVPKTKTFREDSNMGLLEGTVTFVESR